MLPPSQEFRYLPNVRLQGGRPDEIPYATASPKQVRDGGRGQRIDEMRLSSCVTDHFQFGSVVCWGKHRVDTCHDGILNRILVACSALKDWELLQDDNAFL
jgi:hypothetical protein